MNYIETEDPKSKAIYLIYTFGNKANAKKHIEEVINILEHEVGIGLNEYLIEFYEMTKKELESIHMSTILNIRECEGKVIYG